jgi:hypothetical protein
MHHIHLHVQHWVIWWVYVGLILAAVGLVNVLDRHLTRPQEDFAVTFCVLFWLLGGALCYAVDGVRNKKR